MNVVRVRVPATTANLGPGFDCLGIALRVYNVVTVSTGRDGPKDKMVAAAAKAFFRKSGKSSFPFGWSIEGAVPRSRGMGSSVTLRLGLLHGLNELAGRPLDGVALYELCAKLEGHPDNAAPAAFGGFTIVRTGLPLQRYRVDAKLDFVLLIPDFEVSTPHARSVLPAAVPFADAVASAANAALIAGAFASRDYEKLAGGFADGLHQPYREKLVPCLFDVLKAGRKAGALGGWLSGSGSTMACLTLEEPTRVAQAMVKASRLTNTHIIIAPADNTGVRVL